ncbi:MAG TPA: erythromycin esterase family protein, partial [Bryobacteraceae bacterium]|nr:erythromycin esterase family protein [Bryobacteraceae bacterium]
GEWNVGQLMRERHEGQTLSIGFTTNQGTVMAADDWGSPGMVKDVRPSVQGSWERAFAESGIPAFVLNLREEAVARALSATLLERAIGVIYRPDTERQSHYFDAKLAEQFDAVIHFAETRAVEPLDASEVRTSKVEQSVSTLVR